MKITKCDRCGKIFEPSPDTIISADGMRIMYPLKLTFETTNVSSFAYVTDSKELDICDDCQKSLRDWLDEFENGGGSMDA